MGYPKKITKYFFFIVLALLTSPAVADHLTIGFGYSKPPFVFAEHPEQTDELRGIEIDIVKEALAHKEHTLNVVFMLFTSPSRVQLILNQLSPIAGTHG